MDYFTKLIILRKLINQFKLIFAMRKILLLLSLLCGVSGYAEVRTVKFRTGSFLPYAEETLPEKIVTTSPNQTVVKYELIDATIIDDGLYEGAKWLRVPSFGLTIEEGTPSLPFRIETFELPVGCDSVSVKRKQPMEWRANPNNIG